MLEDIEEILIDGKAIQTRVKELGEEISRRYENKDLLLVCILKGGIMFMADLSRCITIPCEFDFMAVTSYGEATESSGVVRILKDLDKSIQNRHVLIIEDVVDTGLTLKYLVKNLENRRPASLKVCSLLNKKAHRKADVKIDFVGFDIPDKFVIGYGLDYAGKYRNLPFISVLKPKIYTTC